MEAILLLVTAAILSAFLNLVWNEVALLIAPEESALLIALYAVNEILTALFWLFVILPLLMGLLAMAAGMERGEDVPLIRVFAPFSGSGEYRRSLRLSFALFWKFLLLVTVVRLTIVFLGSFAGQSAAVPVLIALLTVAEILLWIVLVLRQFPTLYFVYAEGLTVREAHRATATVRRSRSAGILFWLCFLPWILLGLLTVGILLLADVFPRMCIAYFRYAQELVSNSKLSEVSNYE